MAPNGISPPARCVRRTFDRAMGWEPEQLVNEVNFRGLTDRCHELVGRLAEMLGKLGHHPQIVATLEFFQHHLA